MLVLWLPRGTTVMSQHWLTTRYAGRCTICHKPIAVGDHALWDTSIKRLTCQTCGSVSKHGPEMPFALDVSSPRIVVSELYDDLTGEKVATIYDDGLFQYEPFLQDRAAKYVLSILDKKAVAINIGAYAGCDACLGGINITPEHLSSAPHLSKVFGIPQDKVAGLMQLIQPKAQELLISAQDEATEGLEQELAPIIYRGYYLRETSQGLILGGVHEAWSEKYKEATCGITTHEYSSRHLTPRERCLEHLLQGQTGTTGIGQLLTWPVVRYIPPVQPTMGAQKCLCGIHGYYNPPDVIHHQDDTFQVIVQCIAWGNLLYAELGLKASDVEMLRGWILVSQFKLDFSKYVDWKLVAQDLTDRYEIPFQVCKDEAEMLMWMSIEGVYRPMQPGGEADVYHGSR